MLLGLPDAPALRCNQQLHAWPCDRIGLIASASMADRATCSRRKRWSWSFAGVVAFAWRALQRLIHRATDAPRGSAPRRRPGRLLAARPSRQASQAPLLRFLPLQRFPVHVALNRKGHFRFIPASALSFCPCGFSLPIVVRWSPPATASNAIVASLAYSPIRFPCSAAYQSFPLASHGLAGPAKARQRSWGSCSSQFLSCPQVTTAFRPRPTHLPFLKVPLRCFCRGTGSIPNGCSSGPIEGTYRGSWVFLAGNPAGRLSAPRTATALSFSSSRSSRRHETFTDQRRAGFGPENRISFRLAVGHRSPGALPSLFPCAPGLWRLRVARSPAL